MYRVMLVDDEPLAIQGLQLLIDWEKYGFRVESICEDGEEAIRLIRQSAPDLVVTDIRMPSMDGLELIAAARSEGNRSSKFVITSGFNDFDYARRALKLGVSHFLCKPVISEEADDVLAKLQAELDERERAVLIQNYAGRYTIEHLLSALLYGVGATEPEEAALLSRLSADAEAWTYLHIEADNAEIGKARETAEHIAAERGSCYLVGHDRQTFGLVCGFTGSDGLEVRRFTDRLYGSLRHVLSGRLGVAAGCMETSLTTLSRSFNSAMEAGNFLFFDGEFEVVHYADIKDKTLSFDAESWKVADLIVESLEKGNPDELAETVQTAFHRFKREMVRPDMVSVFTMHVMLRCTSVYKEMGGDPNVLLQESEWDGMERHTKQLSDAADFMTSFCLKCRSAIANLQEKRTGGTLAEVADYLRLRFRETVTVKEIAERFYMNPVYLGQAFTRKFGVSILDFLHDLRINEAIRLLLETNTTGSAAAESLGYGSYQHFLKQFEKRTGMKPTEFKVADKYPLIRGG